MNEPSREDWRKMGSAPRDGSRILVAVRASEQGPAEVDVVRWAAPAHAPDKVWIAADSEPDLPVTYGDGELAGWMPVPDPLPPLRGRPAPPDGALRRDGEVDGSSI